MSVTGLKGDLSMVGQPLAHSVMLARQPVFDRERRVHAYELLYRSAGADRAVFDDGTHATAHVAITALLDIGLDRIVQGRQAFINVTRDLLVSRQALALPPSKVILELLEHETVDSELVDAVREFRARGYRFALDDFSYKPGWEPLVEQASLVKLDVLDLGLERVAEHMQWLQRYDVSILAEKVETEAEFEALRTLGCDFFQGYFFARPNIVRGSRLPSNKLAALRLLALLRDPATDLDQVADLVAQDPSLSYRLIRLVNSAAMGLANRVTSVPRAVAYLGLDAVRRWVSLTTIIGMSDKSEELIRLTLIRARMTELLAARLPRCDPDIGFTVGLFSTLDAFMEQPMEEVLGQLRLTPETNAALLDQSGRHGEVLRAVKAYEQGDWESACARAQPLTQGDLGGIYTEAVRWADAAVFEGI